LARLTGAEIKIPFFPLLSTRKHNRLNINPYTYECIDFENLYVLGALAGDKLVRFLQGGAFACAANLFKKKRQMSFNINSRTRTSV